MDPSYHQRVCILILLTISVGLYLDVAFPAWGQATTNVWVWSLFAWMLVRSNGEERVSLGLCLIFATLGEIFLSLVWGLYEYRLGSIPLFVPPGHCLLYFLGVLAATRLPNAAVCLVPTLAAPYICFAALSGQDTESLLWYAVFLVCLRFGPAKKLYATMFVLALVMEIYGTWLGNWVWAGTVPWLGLTSSNPPACAGVFYCLLDLIVTTLTPRIVSCAQRSRTWRMPGPEREMPPP